MSKRKSADMKEYDLFVANTRELLRTRQGKDFVWYVLSMCDVYSVNTDVNMKSYYDGRRSIGLEVLALLEDVDPTAYARLLLSKQEQKQGDTNE